METTAFRHLSLERFDIGAAQNSANRSLKSRFAKTAPSHGCFGQLPDSIEARRGALGEGHDIALVPLAGADDSNPADLSFALAHAIILPAAESAELGRITSSFSLL